MARTNRTAAGSAYRLTLRLADGTERTHDVVTLPRAWKSWLMAQEPYGTAFRGATFAMEPIR